jgi:radical SAM superfamily enzyme YgiQ (UPF0313 family)
VGVLYREAERVCYTGDPGFIEDVNILPFPKYKKFVQEHFDVSKIPLIFSRGCPYSCTFCGAHRSMGKKYRTKNSNTLFKEIHYWYENGKKSFNFVDSELFLEPKILYETLSKLESAGFLDLNLSSDGMRGNSCNIELLTSMKKFGLSTIAVGIESANNDILKKIKKGETIEQISEGITVLEKLNIAVTGFFIIGLPGETVKHIFNSFYYPFRFKNIAQTYFFNLNPIPHTEIYDWYKKHNPLRNASISNNSIHQNIGGMGNDILVESAELPKKTRRLLLKFGRFMQKIFAKRYTLIHEISIKGRIKYFLFLFGIKIIFQISYIIILLFNKLDSYFNSKRLHKEIITGE